MRNVGKQLGVEAMSLYHHVASKDDLLDWVFTLIHLPAPGEPWRAAMRARALSLRRVLSEHTWALALTELKLPFGPAEGAHTFAAELNLSAQDYPHLAELVIGRSYRYADEFENGLTLMFDGLARQVGPPPGRRNRT